MRNLGKSLVTAAGGILLTAYGEIAGARLLTVTGVIVLLVGLALVARERRRPLSKEVQPVAQGWGDDNTVVTDDEVPAAMGSGNTIVRVSDANGNSIINRGGTSIGAGAGYDPGGVIIGSGAGRNLGKPKK